MGHKVLRRMGRLMASPNEKQGSSSMWLQADCLHVLLATSGRNLTASMCCWRSVPSQGKPAGYADYMDIGSGGTGLAPVCRQEKPLACCRLGGAKNMGQPKCVPHCQEGPLEESPPPLWEPAAQLSALAGLRCLPCSALLVLSLRG